MPDMQLERLLQMQVFYINKSNYLVTATWRLPYTIYEGGPREDL